MPARSNFQRHRPSPSGASVCRSLESRASSEMFGRMPRQYARAASRLGKSGGVSATSRLMRSAPSPDSDEPGPMSSTTAAPTRSGWRAA